MASPAKGVPSLPSTKVISGHHTRRRRGSHGRLLGNALVLSGSRALPPGNMVAFVGQDQRLRSNERAQALLDATHLVPKRVHAGIELSICDRARHGGCRVHASVPVYLHLQPRAPFVPFRTRSKSCPIRKYWRGGTVAASRKLLVYH